MGLTTDPTEARNSKILPSGQQEKYVVLSDEERAKGFVRPVRRSYKHVGIAGPRYPIRDLTDEEKQGPDVGYVKFETYPQDELPLTGRFWTQAQLDAVGKGCGTVTTMGRELAETYARDPHFYGATFCCGCGKHLRVGSDGEFVWVDNPGTGWPTGERVGT